jgi:hypothetical protein
MENTITKGNQSNQSNQSNQKQPEATVETVETVVAEAMELTTDEFGDLVNRLSLQQLKLLQTAFAERLDREKNRIEKDILAARGEVICDLNIKAISKLLQEPDTTAELLKTLPKSLFNQLFLAAMAAVAPAAEVAGKPAKHNDLSHKFMLSVACYSYLKEANVDNFNSRPVQPLEPLTLADFMKHCEKNTFANNTNYPVVIDKVSYADKKSAVQAMAELMFNWYKSAITASQGA